MGDPERRRSPSARWPFLVAAAAVYFGGRGLPLPGVDHELLAELSQGGGLLGLFDQATVTLSLVGMTVSALVLVQLVLAVGGALERPLARRIGLVIYLAACAVQGFAIALWCEGLNTQAPFADVVPTPGMAFRLTTAVGITAGGALLWWVAGRLDRARAATGFAFLALLACLTDLWHDASQLGESMARGEDTLLEALAHFALPLALATVAATLVSRPVRFPVKLVGPITLVSGWDALAIPAVVSVPLTNWSAVISQGSPVLHLVAAVAEIGAAIAFGVVWRQRAVDSKAGRVWGPAAVGALALFGALGVAMLTFGAAGGAERLGPGPLAGDASFTLVLEAEGRFADGDGAAMVERLEDLGASGSVEAADDQRITLHVEGAAGPDEVADALQPHVLELSFTVELDEDPLRGALPTVPSGDYGSGRIRGWRGPCDEIEHMLDEPPPGCDVPAFEGPGDPDYQPDCTLHCLEPELVLSTADVESARVVADPQMGAPIVTAQLTSPAARRFGDATGRHIHRALAIVVDGEVVSAPIVQSRIDGGRIQVTLGDGRNLDAQRREAEALARALGPGARVSTPFVVAEIR